MPMTTTWANLVGDHVIGKSDIGALADIWMGLFTADPGDSGSQTSEVTGTGYARINVTSSMGAFAAKVSISTAEINFGSPGSDWGTIAYVGFLTASSGGTMKYHEALPNPRNATSGSRPVKFASGQVQIRHE